MTAAPSTSTHRVHTYKIVTMTGTAWCADVYVDGTWRCARVRATRQAAYDAATAVLAILFGRSTP